jgi:hypothetical protein
MKLREYLDKSEEQEDPKSRIIRAIDLAKDQMDLEMALSLLASANDKMTDDDIMMVKQHFDAKYNIMKSQHRSLQ